MPTQKLKKYKRILLKLSGEQLIGDEGFGIDPKVLDKMADVAEILGGEWIGGRNFKQTNKTDGLAGFVVAALDAAEERLGVPAEA